MAIITMMVMTIICWILFWFSKTRGDNILPGPHVYQELNPGARHALSVLPLAFALPLVFALPLAFAVARLANLPAFTLCIFPSSKVFSIVLSTRATSLVCVF